MKNIICGLACFIMILSLAACEKEKKEESLLERASKMEQRKTF